jgi:hypothetical protein
MLGWLVGEISYLMYVKIRLWGSFEIIVDRGRREDMGK